MKVRPNFIVFCFWHSFCPSTTWPQTHCNCSVGRPKGTEKGTAKYWEMTEREELKTVTQWTSGLTPNPHLLESNPNKHIKDSENWANKQTSTQVPEWPVGGALMGQIWIALQRWKLNWHCNHSLQKASGNLWSKSNHQLKENKNKNINDIHIIQAKSRVS